MIRKPFIWDDPTSGNEYELWVTPEIVSLLENVIETEAQAEDFYSAYENVSPQAEQNLGYMISLVKDKDVQEDLLDLFMIELDHNPCRFLFGEYPKTHSCCGVKNS